MLTVKLALQLACKCGNKTDTVLCKKEQRAKAEIELRQFAAKAGWATAPKLETCPNCRRVQSEKRQQAKEAAQPQA